MRESRRPPFFKFIEYPREEFSLRGYFFLPIGLYQPNKASGANKPNGPNKSGRPNKPNMSNRPDGANVKGCRGSIGAIINISCCGACRFSV